MYYPTFDEVRQLRAAETAPAVEKSGRPLLPLYCDILADPETPVSSYCNAAQGPYSFLLESVTAAERLCWWRPLTFARSDVASSPSSRTSEKRARNAATRRVVVPLCPGFRSRRAPRDDRHSPAARCVVHIYPIQR